MRQAHNHPRSVKTAVFDMCVHVRVRRTKCVTLFFHFFMHAVFIWENNLTSLRSRLGVSNMCALRIQNHFMLIQHTHHTATLIA